MTNNTLPHFEVHGGKKLLYVKGEPQILLAGEIHNSNSTTPEVFQASIDKAKALGIQVLLIPVTWEMVEPEEGVFTFDLVGELLKLARQSDVKLGILWFGAWKNSQCMYVPGWVKKDMNRFKRAEMIKGKARIELEHYHGMGYSTLSYLCEETKLADAKAFCAFMQYLKDNDSEDNTVLYVQVENETGVMGAARELSDEADALFDGAAPQGLVEYLRANTQEMDPELRADVEQGAANASGDAAPTWQQAFGGSAEEVFSAYYTASYCNYLAEKGKEVYDIPMAVNCWLKQGPVGTYPTGGPTYQMMEVWEYAAPSIEVFCPDIYVKNYLEICDNYVKRGNPLFIPETATNGHVGPRLVHAVGHYHAACFAPFGFEDLGTDAFNPMMSLFGGDSSDPLLQEKQDVAEYRQYSEMLAQLMPKLTAAYGTDRLQAVISERPDESAMRFGEFELRAITDAPLFPKKDGVCLALQESEDEFYVIINRAALQYASANPDKPNCEFLSIDEGKIVDGKWQTTLHRNGDEAQMLFFFKPTLLKIKLFTY